ncbi:hypothetical protein ABPG77_002939 [Micractinium sp. CCAP 211/92]
MAGRTLSQGLTAEEAREKIKAQGGSILFEKVLTSSDVSGTGRLVIPKSQAEAHFPRLEEQSGMNLEMTDTEGSTHTLRFRFWANNQSRMYLLEHTSPVQAKYRMQAGDVLVFSQLPQGRLGIAGRKGTKDDVSRKPPTRRAPSAPPGSASSARPHPDAEAGGGGRKRSRLRGDSLKAKRQREKAALQEVRSLFGYWNAHSLPPRRDGVFRAAPAGAAQDADRVVAQYGAWSALVNLGGEPFQAFFDSREAAAAALQAALQSAGSAEPAASGPGGPRSSSGAQGAAAGQVAAEGGSPAAEGGAAAAARPALAAEVEGLSLGVPKAETSSPSETAAAAAGSAATGPARGGAAGLPAVAAPDIQQAQRLPAAVPKLEPAEQAYP